MTDPNRRKYVGIEDVKRTAWLVLAALVTLWFAIDLVRWMF